MMSTERQAVELTAVVLRNAPNATPSEIEELLRIGRRLNTWNTTRCNRPLTQRDERTIANLILAAVRITRAWGVTIGSSTEPAGFPIELYFTDRSVNDFTSSFWGVGR